MSVPGGEAFEVRAALGRGAEGFLVVDSTVGCSSSGGLRIAEDLGVEEVAALAREMTLKFAFVGRASGGAKSGLRLPAGAGPAERRRCLQELGRRFAPLLRRGIYSPGTDLGCGRADLAEVYAGAGLRLGRMTDTSLFTAIGAAGALAACREWLGSPARPLRLAIEGFGAVATWLVERLPPEEFVVTAISTARGAALEEGGFDPRRLAEERRRSGDALVERLGRPVDRDRVFAAEVDVFVPSARTWSLSVERARSLAARCVAPLANAPYAGGAVEVLEARGVACLPGFVVNGGGVFASSLFDGGAPLAAVERVAAREFRAVVRALLEARSRAGLSPAALAEEIAVERLGRRGTVPLESPWVRLARGVVRRRLPRRLAGAVRLAAFSRNLMDLERTVARRAGEGTSAPRRTGT